MSKTPRAGAPVIELTEEMIAAGSAVLENVWEEINSAGSREIVRTIFKAMMAARA